jgi:hypothetical protein
MNAQQAKKLESHLDAEPCPFARSSHNLALDSGFERKIPNIVVERNIGSVITRNAKMNSGDLATCRCQFCSDWGTSILPRKLSELSLSREQPQRVGDFGTKPGPQVWRPRQRLEPLPGRY